MPFTFAHPAVVLPLNRLMRNKLSLTGLVTGSMIPDFEGFLLVTDVKTYSHTWHGMFWLDIPLGLGLAFLFHLVVRNTLIDNLPAFFKRRLIGYKELDWNYYFRRHWGSVLISLLIGIFSHILWDDFTHLTGFMVQHISFLRNWYSIGGKLYPVYKILQLGTSVLGMLAVVIWVGYSPQDPNVKRHNNWVYWIIVFCIMGAFVAFRFLLGLELFDISLLFVTAMSGALFGVTIASVITREMHVDIGRR